MTPQFNLQVNLDELRLILKALGGRMKTEDHEIAKTLCDNLTAQRADALEQTAVQLRKALEL